jgi:hypothetical protein
MDKKRVFISFAVPEDTYARDFLVGQARNKESPFEFIDMSVKEPWSESWKMQCRTKIRGCDGVVALLSKSTGNSSGARWEMRCAVEERIPIIGVHIKSDDKGAAPAELSGKRIINWTWDGIANFINSL